MAVTKTLELVRHYDKPASVILTFCPVRGREMDDTEDAIRAMQAEIAPVRIHNLIAYSRAQQTGLAAQEFEPDGKAALEIKQLYDYTCMQLYRGEQPMASSKNALQAVLTARRRRSQHRRQSRKYRNRPKPSRTYREGRKLVSAHVRNEVHRELKLLAVEEESDIQHLLEEAIDLLFIKKGKPPMARAN